jgi:iron complex outermembrane recepter protein
MKQHRAPKTSTLDTPAHHKKRQRDLFALRGSCVAVHAALVLGVGYASLVNMPAASAQAATPTPAEAVYSFSIPAGPLDRALNALASAAGAELSIDADLLKGKSSHGLAGRFTLREGFAELLRGQNLQALRQSNGSYTLQKISVRATSSASTTEIVLPAVRVTAQPATESTNGPVSGYVARRASTASKDDTPLMETPQSVSVITRDQMDEQSAQNVTDALRYVAGVNTATYGDDPRYDWITMRGFNQSVFGLYRDGLRTSASKIGMRIDSYGLERIEVLKGPASVLYGQNAPGGLVNAVTKRPADDIVQELGVTVGSHDLKQLQFDVGGALNEARTLSYRLTGTLRDSNTQMDYIPDDHTSIAPALTWKPDDSTSLTILASYQKDKTAWGLWYPRTGTLLSSTTGQIQPNFYPGEPSFNSFDRIQKSLSTLFEKKLGNGLTFRQGLRAESMRYDAKFVRARARLNDDYDLDESGHLLYRDANRNRLESKVYTMDNQLTRAAQLGATTHHLLLGLDVSRTRYKDRQYSGSAPVLDLLDPVYGQTITEPTSLWARNVSASQTGLYLQDRVEYKDWIVRAGARHDRTHTDTINPLGTLALRQKDNATTYQGGVLYRGIQNFAPFINYAQSFQPTAQASQTGDAFKPTTGNSIEAGVRYQPESGRGMLTAAVFEIRQNNVLTQDPNDSNNTIQTGQVRSRGLELEGRWDLSRQLSMLATYTLLDAKVTRSTTLGQLGTRPQDAWGTTSPRNSGSLWTTYRFTPEVLRGVSVGGGLRYVGSTLDYGASTSDPDNNYATSVKTPSYTVYDMMLGYELDTHWRFQLKVNNLLDKLYVANPCGATQLGTCYYGPTRSFLANATYRW